MNDGREGVVETGIKSKEVIGSCTRIGVQSGMASDMLRKTTDELLTLLHTLSRTSYAQSTDKQHGFIYTFPLAFGE